MADSLHGQYDQQVDMTHIRQKSSRMFFALWPSAAERIALASWQPYLHELLGGRVMQPNTLHVTLVFLGLVVENRLEALQLAAQEVDFQPFDLRLTEVHYWEHNRIVYAAPEVIPARLAALVDQLAAKLSNHCFNFDRRSYKPHVTLLRNAKWSDPALPIQPEACWKINKFVLVQSKGDEQGPCYEVLACFPAKSDF